MAGRVYHTRPFLPKEARISGRKKAHKHKLFALVNVQMALGQTAGCPRVNRAKKFMCSPRNTGNINFSLWLTSGLSQGCPDFQEVYVFKVYVPFSCPRIKCDTPPLQSPICHDKPFLWGQKGVQQRRFAMLSKDLVGQGYCLSGAVYQGKTKGQQLKGKIVS